MRTVAYKILRGFSVLAAVAIAPGSAKAEAPSYVGTWASDLAQCKAAQDRPEAPLLLKEKGFDQHETHCAFTSVSGADDEWKVRADCRVEGNAEPYDFLLTVSGNTLSLTDEAGTRDLLRCR